MPAIFYRGGWTRSVVRLPDVKGKNIISLLPTKPTEHLLKANLQFFNDNRIR